MQVSNARLGSIQFKISLWTGLCLLLTSGVIITYAALALRNTAAKAAEERAIGVAEQHAGAVRAELEVAFDTARTLAQVLASTRSSSENSTALSREQVNAMLRQILVDNPQLVGVWTLWEPDAFDGQDARYANTEGHDQTGRLLPYWTRNEQGEIAVEPLTDYETAEWYLCPMQTGKECILDPFTHPVQGRDVLMTTLTVPIFAGGEFYGVAGVDVGLHFLQSLADEINLYGGSGRLILISHSGALAGVTGQPEMVGQYARVLYPDFETGGKLRRIRQGQRSAAHQGENLEVMVPIQFGRTTTPWSVNILIPVENVLAEATGLMWQMIGIGAVLVLAALALVWLAAGQVAKPIQRLTETVRAAATGNLNVKAEVKANNEIGVLAQAFNQMTDNLRQRIRAEQEASQKAVQLAEAERLAKERLDQTVSEYLTFVEQIGSGDLTRRLSLNGDNDGLTVLGRNLNSMVDRLAEMTRQIRAATTDIASAAAEILAATTQHAAGANEQSAAISQTSTTIDEVKAIVEQSLAKAQMVAQQALRSQETSNSGQQAVVDTVEMMTQIKERVEGIAENILALSEQTQQIGEITQTVNEIASQSNLLALNASVEAARAGEHGKGFAVVAVEVRNLAEQSRQATAQVKAILNEVQRATNMAVMATEEGTKGADLGVKQASLAGETIQRMSLVIGENARAAQQVVASAQQQTTGMEQIALAMDNINQATLQSLTSTRQAEKAARNLSALAQQMEHLITRYKLN